MDGLNILVAGAGRGIGATVAKMAASRGARVVVGDIDLTLATSTAEDIQRNGGFAKALQFDMSNENSIENLVTDAVEALGSLDGLVNMVADTRLSIMDRDVSVEHMDPELWTNVLTINLIGFGLTTKYAIPHLKQSKAPSPAIVNVSSAAAITGEAVRPAYAASKAGVNALTRHSARLLAPYNIRANAVAPGLTATNAIAEMMENTDVLKGYVDDTPLARPGKPGEVAATILFLLSQDASYITGQVWGIDGGTRFRDE